MITFDPAFPMPEKQTYKFINQDKEIAYKKLESILTKLESKGPNKTRELLLDLLNTAREQDGDAPIDKELLNEVGLKIVTSDSASQIAKQTITRPVFIFKSLNAFKKFISVLRNIPVQNVTTRAFVTTLNLQIDKEKTTQVELIISTATDQDHIAHEIRHTIDPLLHERIGYDRILSEVFAYYWEAVIAKKNSTDPEKVWRNLRAAIWSDKDGYFKEYSTEASKKITFEEYGNLTGKIIEAVKKIHQKTGDHLETQRIIGKIKTLGELFQMTNL